MCVILSFFFFFFKQKTAYEMRISDWSSDVCSSDLGDSDQQRPQRADAAPYCIGSAHRNLARSQFKQAHAERDRGQKPQRPRQIAESVDMAQAGGEPDLEQPAQKQRSEEHTSELQSLMRISYAVFCLKKNNDNNTNTNPPYHTYKNTYYRLNPHTITILHADPF